MPITKKTKIVATLGPATENAEVMDELIASGVDVVRLNFSHSDFETHKKRMELAQASAKKIGKTIAVLQDLGGPKIRIGQFYQPFVNLKEGDDFTLTIEECVGDEHKASVNYPNLPKELEKGDFILVDDGKKKFEVLETNAKEVKCKIIVGGETYGKRGLNLPGVHLSMSSITDKDKSDLQFAFQNNVDFVALSFVRKPEDILELRELLKAAKSEAKIVAKIETAEAIENLDKIIDATDVVMVARGDLATEIGIENVPVIQKAMIKKCNLQAKPVITATQMLESMIELPVPTRAEVSDVANAILDGTDAVMLSAESAMGKYPIEAVKMLTKIAERTEKDYNHRRMYFRIVNHEGIKDSLSEAVISATRDSGAKLIFAFTESGQMAKLILRYRPIQTTIAFSPSDATSRQLQLSFGCVPAVIERMVQFEKALEFASDFALKNKLAEKGDKVVVVSGAPFNWGVDSNSILVRTL